MSKKPSALEVGFMQVWRMIAGDQYPFPKREIRFHPKRMWRFDFAWEAHRVAVEMEGGVMSFPVKCNTCGRDVYRKNKRTGKAERVYAAMGAHTRSAGFQNDCEKYNAAASLGWRVLRYSIGDLEKRPVQMIKEIAALLAKGPRVDMETQSELFE